MPDLPPRTFVSPEGLEAQAPGNAASNGHWIHGAYGPRHYVAPRQPRPEPALPPT